MTFARRTIFALLLATVAIARAEPTTSPANGASPVAAADEFDPAAFPLDSDLRKLTRDQTRQVLSLRALAAQARRAAGILADVARPLTHAATTPTTAPADLVASVARLADRDPAARSAARSALMSLDLDAMYSLRDALAGVTISRAQASALRDAVVQVVLVSQHGFRGNGGPGGALGVSVCASAGNAPVVVSRMPGWDGYRALEDGDAIVGLIVPVGRGAARRPGDAVTPIRGYADLQGALAAVRPGDRVVARVLRNGVPADVELRAARPMTPRPDNLLINPASETADKIWLTQFMTRLRVAPPTTRAVQ